MEETTPSTQFPVGESWAGVMLDRWQRQGWRKAHGPISARPPDEPGQRGLRAAHRKQERPQTIGPQADTMVNERLRGSYLHGTTSQAGVTSETSKCSPLSPPWNCAFLPQTQTKQAPLPGSLPTTGLQALILVAGPRTGALTQDQLPHLQRLSQPRAKTDS